jgi:hypothetical protein
MDFAAALAGLKNASDLTTRLREALKSRDVKLDEVVARIIEVQDRISDGRAALIDAQETVIQKTAEILDLKARLREVDEVRQTRQSLKYDGRVYWKAGDPEFPFCPVCWDTTSTLVRLQDWGTETYSGVQKTDYRCLVHNQSFMVPARR